MRPKYLPAFLIALLGLGMIAFSIPGPAPLKERLQQALDTWRSDYPQEKVYLHFDKDYYSSGEVIWFKAYVTRDQAPTDYSTNLYVELIDKKGKILQRNTLPVLLGGAWGDFELPQDLPQGNYRVRAYTAWMLNFDPAFLFEKDLHVYNPAETRPETARPGGTAPAQEAPADSSAFSVQFFPEGGNLVNGVQSTVAFKAIGTDGHAIAVSGSIADEQGNRITGFSSLHDGMGTFELTPAAGHRYFATALSAGSTASRSFPLPAAQPSGVVLHTVRTPANPGRVFFRLSPSPGLPAAEQQLVLAAQFQGHLVYCAPIDFQAGLSGGMIPVDGLPSGILQITLFRADGMPLAERLVFVRNNDELPMRLTTQELNLGARGKSSFRLEVTDSLQGHFSVSVTDADQVSHTRYAGNILSGLLLTADLKGYIENPGWYFQNDNDSTNQALDLVMLTNGWRRFTWPELLGNRYPRIQYPAERNLLSVNGKATERKKPLEHGKIEMFLKSPTDSVTYFINVPVDQGSFAVPGLVFHDTAFLYYKGADSLKKNRIVDVAMQPHFTRKLSYIKLLHAIYPRFTPPPAPELSNYLDLSRQRNDISNLISKRSVLLKEVKVKAHRLPPEKKIEDRYTSGMFKSDNAYTFDMTKEIPSYSSIFQFLQGRVAGLMVSGDIFSNPSVRWRGGTPAFYLDEAPVDASTLATVPVPDVALIKVFRPPFMGGFGGGSGAIAVYTRRGGDDDGLLRRGFEKVSLPGYSWTREFYHPDYSVKKEINELPDKRATLYWNPDLVTDSLHHSADFSFYNTDITRRIRIVIEGIDLAGHPGRYEAVFPK
ncbi:hypothetical protein [Compostibacter hankyongensis]|uniref:Plug domain-containing protein n=1 Tax=Compostibacter hankyongensis TaxID=1007089 RepID=A0ABP8FR74_9BACT